MAHEVKPALRTESLVLPEPGRQLLHAGYPILRRWLTDRPGQASFIIGGGTMLAARWHHRSSKDIDVKVNGETGYALVSRAREEPMIKAELDRRMTAAGSSGGRWLSPVQLVYTFGAPGDDDPPRIDLTEFAPKMPMAVIRTTSEGMTFWSSTNEEILAGKWKDRRFYPPVRDVFDFAVAGLEDGPALQGALAMDARAEALNDMVRRLAKHKIRLQAEAHTSILGVPDDLGEVLKDPARWAALSIGMWAATEVRVEREGSNWHVSTACKAQSQGCAQGTYGDLTSAVRRASALGGLSSEDKLELYEEASNQGGGNRPGGGSGISKSWQRGITVGKDGTVVIRDFGETTVKTPTIEAAADVMIERGWEREAKRTAAVEELRELQQQAIAHWQERTRN